MKKVTFENGDGKFVRLIYFNISIGIAIIGFGAAMAQPFILGSKLNVRIEQTEIRIKVTEIDIVHLKKVDSSNKGLAKEIKFNLKRFMESQGIQYIEDADK